MVNTNGINHHFEDTDNINSYMIRCLNSKMATGMERNHAIGVCHSEFKHKKQKKQMIKHENKKK